MHVYNSIIVLKEILPVFPLNSVSENGSVIDKAMDLFIEREQRGDLKILATRFVESVLDITFHLNRPQLFGCTQEARICMVSQSNGSSYEGTLVFRLVHDGADIFFSRPTHLQLHPRLIQAQALPAIPGPDFRRPLAQVYVLIEIHQHCLRLLRQDPEPSLHPFLCSKTSTINLHPTPLNSRWTGKFLETLGIGHPSQSYQYTKARGCQAYKTRSQDQWSG